MSGNILRTVRNTTATASSYDLAGPMRRYRKPGFRVLLMAGLGLLAWYATYDGLHGLIAHNIGTIPTNVNLLIMASVSLLILMIVYLLDKMYETEWSQPVLKSFYVVAYLFLTLISVGFGFGFYWKIINAEGASVGGARASVNEISNGLAIGEERLRAVAARLDEVVKLSGERANAETAHGNTCLDGSRATEGPRARLRQRDAAEFAAAARLIRGRTDAIAPQSAALQASLSELIKKTATNPTEKRKIVTDEQAIEEEYAKLNREAGRVIALFNDLKHDPQVIQLRDRFRERASTVVFPMNDGVSDRTDAGRRDQTDKAKGRAPQASGATGGTFNCRDTELQSALLGAAAALEGLPTLTLLPIRPKRGSAAVVEAFTRLTTTVSNALGSVRLPTWRELSWQVEENRRQARHEVDKAEKPSGAEAKSRSGGLQEEDLIPLIATIFVDFCLLVVAFDRRRNILRDVERHIASDAQTKAVAEAVRRLYREIGAEELNAKYTIRHWGSYYVVVPERLLDENEEFTIDASMYTMFVALDDLGVMREVRDNRFLNVRKKLEARGRILPQNSNFYVFKMKPGVMPALIRALALEQLKARGNLPTSRPSKPQSEGSATPARTVPTRGAPQTRTNSTSASTSTGFTSRDRPPE